MRRATIIQLVVVGILVGAAVTLVALLVPWLPRPASREAGRIDFVFWFVTGICIAIFALVGAVIVYSVLKFRARPDDDSDGLPIHGHTGLEIAWTAFPAVLVTAISIVSAIVLAQNGRAARDHLTVDVTGQQFAWSFKYPDYNGLTSGSLYLQKDKSTELRITSKDVIHSFWVAEFGQKQDAVPGQINKLVITPTRLGTYAVICTELCGLGHAVMRTEAVVLTPTDFDNWVKKQQQALSGGAAGGAGKAVFVSNGCGGCHTFQPAGANQKIGPDLDKLPAEARRAGKPLEAFVRESIVKPGAYLEPGYKDIMPHDFGQKIPPDQLDALVKYLVAGSKKGG